MSTKTQLGADGADEQLTNYLNDRIATDRFIDRKNTRRADREDAETEIHCECCGTIIKRWPRGKEYSGRSFCKKCEKVRKKRIEVSRLEASKTDNRNFLDNFWADCKAAGCDFTSYCYVPPSAPWGLFPGAKFKRALFGSQMLADKVLVSFEERAEKEELKTEEVVIGGQKGEVVIARPLEYLGANGEIKAIKQLPLGSRVLLPFKRERLDAELYQWANEVKARPPMSKLKIDNTRALFRDAVRIVDDAIEEMEWELGTYPYFDEIEKWKEIVLFNKKLRRKLDAFATFISIKPSYVGECFRLIIEAANYLKTIDASDDAMSDSTIIGRLNKAYNDIELAHIAALRVVENADYFNPGRTGQKNGKHHKDDGDGIDGLGRHKPRSRPPLSPVTPAQLIDYAKIVRATILATNFIEIGDLLRRNAVGWSQGRIQQYFNRKRTVINDRRKLGYLNSAYLLQWWNVIDTLPPVKRRKEHRKLELRQPGYPTESVFYRRINGVLHRVTERCAHELDGKC